MKGFILIDKEYRTDQFVAIYDCVSEFLNGKKVTVTQTEIGRDDLAYCMGCFGCWVKTPGECVIKDMETQINRDYINSDVVIYLCPVVFGQFSANMKNAIDRWLPNVLPFFEMRKDGSTIHPTRYDNYPRQIMIAYADDLSQEDAELFCDISMKHRHAVDIIIYKSPEDLKEQLNRIELKKVGALL